MNSTPTISPAARIPRAPGSDNTLALLRDGYQFIQSRCDSLGSDGFRTRLMLREVICLRGTEAQALLYGTPGLTRKGAMPGTVLRLLQDKGSVQQMEGAAHARRKALFMGLLLKEDAVDALVERFTTLFRERLARGGDIELLSETSALLSRAASEWVGLPDDMAQSPALARALFAMSDRTGHFGPGTWAALAGRRAVEKQLRHVVNNARTARFKPVDPDQPLHRFSAATDPAGAPLSAAVVAVELLNLLRPIVAVGRYIAFAAHALAVHPQWKKRLAAGEDDMFEPFAEEVRRCYPFFPFTAAITTQEVNWRGATIPRGQWIIADLYGTAHDPRLFPDPGAFRPERGLSWRDPAPGFAPQGAGDTASTHRCPGEMTTVGLMAAATRVLTREFRYDLPREVPEIALDRIPAQPAGGMWLSNVTPADQAGDGTSGAADKPVTDPGTP